MPWRDLLQLPEMKIKVKVINSSQLDEKVLGIMLDRHLTFDKHMSAVV